MSGEDKIYHAFLKKELNLKEARNYGKSGTRIARQDDGEEKYFEDFIREVFCPDGLHPNDEGHRLIADRRKGFLMSM